MKKVTSLFLLIILSSCDDLGSSNKEKELSSSEQTFLNIVRGSDTKFTYFSLEKNDTVSVSDPKNSTEWDIAFGKRNAGSRPDGNGGTVTIFQSAIITNSGFSGSGGAKSYLLIDTNYDDVLEMTDHYIDSLGVDKMSGSILSPAIKTGSGTWYTYDSANHRLTPNPLHTILIKTVKGHYAKLKVRDMYYKESLTSDPDYMKFGYFTIQYFLQNDLNSKDLK